MNIVSRHKKSFSLNKGKFLGVLTVCALFLTFNVPIADAATAIYRSVAPALTTALTTGASNALTISGSTATFATALADNIGVGDAIQYDDDGDGDIDTNDSIVFIHGRTSSTVYTVKTAAGTAPTAVVGDTDWSLFRAYTSLFNAEAGTENTGIDADLRDFDTHTTGVDLVAGDLQWNIALYANSTTADTTSIAVSGWVSDATRYIRIYTATSTAEVGTSQRHAGVWDANKYKLQYTSGGTFFTVNGSYTVIDGLQVQPSSTNGIEVSNATSTYISNNIVRNLATPGSGGQTGIRVTTTSFGAGGGLAYIYNNIMYGNRRGMEIAISLNGTAFVYNNTASSSTLGFLQTYSSTGETIYEKNNIAFGQVASGAFTFSGTANTNYANNVSSDGTAVGTASKTSQTPTFVSIVNGSENLHLASGDTVAKNAGADLSADPNFAIFKDIDAEVRTGTWDMGADEELTSDVTNPTVSSFSPLDDATGVATTTNLVITFDEAVDAESGNITLFNSSDTQIEAFNVTSQISGSGTTVITVNPTANLDYSTGYYVQIDATAFDDASSNSYAGISNKTTWNFTTEDAPGDVTVPTVSLTAPSDTATVTGASVTVSANASDNVAVAGVQFKLDTNTNIGAEDTSSAYSVSWDTTGVADGVHTLIAVARDTSNNYATSSSISVTVDNTAPVRSAGSPSGSLSTGTTTVRMYLTTNEAATCKYGTVASTAYGSIASTFATTTGTLHEQTITGLSNGNTYTYYVRCIDGQSNANSSDYTITFDVAADASAPTVSLTAPSNAATVSGASVTISANASDDVAIAGVQFKRATNTNIGSEDTSSAYSVTWDTTAVSDGSHTLIAVARDTSNNYATSSSVTVTVDNTAPVRSAGSPSGTLTTGTTTVRMSLTTNEAATCKYGTVASTAYGSIASTFATTTGTSHEQTITGLTDGGSYAYYVRCIDGQSNANSSDYTITFDVAADASSPTVSLTAPSDGETVSGSSITISANASDDISVSGVQFKLDTNTNIGSEDTTSAYSVSWDTTGVADGVHTLIAVARDGSGNYATSSARSVTVDNTAPVRSNGSPSGAQASGTTGLDIELDTDETATCKYDTNTSTAYGSMSGTFDTTNSTSHSEAITGLSDGTSYTYYVRCIDGEGNANGSDFSISFSVATAGSDVTDPSAPTHLEASLITEDSLRLTWTASTDDTAVTGYSIYRDGVEVGTATLTRYSDTGLHSGTEYIYKVVAFDAADNESLDSQELEIRTGTPSSPSGTFQTSHRPAQTSTATVASSIEQSLIALIDSNRDVFLEAQAQGIVLPDFVLEILNRSVTPTSSSIFTRDLELFSTGPDVRVLQEFLKKENKGPAAQTLILNGISGYFGPLTHAALAEFQAAVGITPSAGYFGPKTRAYLSSLGY